MSNGISGARRPGSTWPGGRGVSSRIVDTADMGCDDVPSVVETSPGLLLPTGFAFHGVAVEEGGGGGEIAAERCDDGSRNDPRQAGGGTGGTERADFIPSVKDLTDAVTDRVGTVPEQRLERIDIVGHQRGFVTGEGGFDLCFDLGQVDVHGWSPGAGSLVAVSKCSHGVEPL